MTYLNNLLIALSQLFNTFLGGNPNELFSARVYRNNNKWTIQFINLLFFDVEHCKKSFEFELKNEQLPEYKNLKL